MVGAEWVGESGMMGSGRYRYGWKVIDKCGYGNGMFEIGNGGDEYLFVLGTRLREEGGG